MSDEKGLQTKRNTFREMLVSRKERIDEVIPPVMRGSMTAENIIAQVQVAALKNRDLERCDPVSILTSVLGAVRSGLDCSGVTGEAYLIPYKTTCNLVIGYRGLIKVMRRAPGVVSVDAHCVYEGDEFDYRLGTDPIIRHIPGPDSGGDHDLITHAYAIVWFRDAGGAPPLFEVMPRVEMDRILANTRSPAIKDHRAEFYRKTVIRRIAKRMPSDDIDRAIVAEEHPDAMQVMMEPSPRLERGQSSASPRRAMLDTIIDEGPPPGEKPFDPSDLGL